MDKINEYGTQREEEEENVPEAQVLAPTLATPAPAPVLSYVASVAIPQQRLSRAQLQLLLDSTRWAPDHEQICFVDLDGEFSLADLMHIMYTTNWADIDSDWEDDGRFDGDVGILTTTVHHRPGEGQGKKGVKGQKRKRTDGPLQVRFKGPDPDDGGAGGGADGAARV